MLCAKLLQSCPTLCDPMDHNPPGSSVHGILQARTVEWVAISSSRGSSRPRGQTCISSSPSLSSEFFTTSAKIHGNVNNVLHEKIHLSGRWKLSKGEVHTGKGWMMRRPGHMSRHHGYVYCPSKSSQSPCHCEKYLLHLLCKCLFQGMSKHRD